MKRKSEKKSYRGKKKRKTLKLQQGVDTDAGELETRIANRAPTDITRDVQREQSMDEKRKVKAQDEYKVYEEEIKLRKDLKKKEDNSSYNMLLRGLQQSSCGLYKELLDRRSKDSLGIDEDEEGEALDEDDEIEQNDQEDVDDDVQDEEIEVDQDEQVQEDEEQLQDDEQQEDQIEEDDGGDEDDEAEINEEEEEEDDADQTQTTSDMFHVRFGSDICLPVQIKKMLENERKQEQPNTTKSGKQKVPEPVVKPIRTRWQNSWVDPDLGTITRYGWPDLIEGKVTTINANTLTQPSNTGEKLSIAERLIQRYEVKNRLATHWSSTRSNNQNTFDSEVQFKIFQIARHYVDIHFVPSSRWELNSNTATEDDAAVAGADKNLQDGDLAQVRREEEYQKQIRKGYLLHILNHMLKTRDVITKNTSKLKHQREVADSSLRDQGFTRPKILILVPFKNAGLQVVELLLSLLPESHVKDITNKDRLKVELGLEDADEEESSQQFKVKPMDWKLMFKGNIDDSFKLNITLSAHRVRLFTDFYKSDIIIASPLGLRTIIGSEGDRGRHYDFLSSIEIVAVEGFDVISIMQNMDHLRLIFKHLNQVPGDKFEKTEWYSKLDFRRIKNWMLNDNGATTDLRPGTSNIREELKFFRQNMFFGEFQVGEINQLMKAECLNFSGGVTIRPETYPGTIRLVVPKIRQIFYRAPESETTTTVKKRKRAKTPDDLKFEYFQNKIFPQIKELVNSVIKNYVIIVNNYYDYVRVRNYLRAFEAEYPGEIAPTFLCEYSEPASISRARNFFFKGKRNILVMTERFHFFRRYWIRGMKGGILFYGLPYYSRFYSEYLNMMEQSEGNAVVLWNKFDMYQLERLLGTEPARNLVESAKKVVVYC